MKVGDLVRLTQEICYDVDGSEIPCGELGIITKHDDDGFLVVVYFLNGEGFWLRPNSFEVISESR